MHSDYYVYEWYIEDTGHVFYVGKGRLDRISEIRNRNKYFLAKYKKYKCMARKIKEGLTNEEACELEKVTIKQRKKSGEAECNFTYGGEGFSEGDLNPMYGVKLCGKLNGFYGRHHSQETKELISAKRIQRKRESNVWKNRLVSPKFKDVCFRRRSRPTNIQRVRKKIWNCV